MPNKWPKTELNIAKRLQDVVSKFSLSPPTVVLEDDEAKAADQAESSEEQKKEPEEYNGIDPLTFIGYGDGEEKHYRILL